MKTMKKGSITVFFSLIFTVVLALICTVIESARVYVAGVRAYGLTCMAVESEFAGYSKEVFDEYGVLLLWQNDIKKDIQNYININNGETITGNFDILNISLKSVQDRKIEYATDNGGDEYVRQILKYTKYQAFGDAAGQLLEYLDVYKANISDANTELSDGDDKESDEESGNIEENDTGKDTIKDSSKDKDIISDEDIAKLQEITDRYNEKACLIKNTEFGYEKFTTEIQNIVEASNAEKSDYSKKEIRKLIKAFKRLRKSYDDFYKEVQETLEISEEYVEEKYKILENKVNMEAYQTSDYVEQDKALLDNVLVDMQSVSNEMIDLAIQELNAESVLDKEKFETVYFNPLKKEMEWLEASISAITTMEISKQDKENISIYKEARSLLKSGVLELVIPENIEISAKAIAEKGLPSENMEESKKNILGNVGDKAMFVYYVSDHFSDFTDGKNDNTLSYQLEYILQGNMNDKDNLFSTVTELVAIRQIFNTIYISTDKEKVAYYATLASSISAGLGVPFIQPIVKAILIEADALRETINDIRTLLKGEKVKLLKSDNQSMDVELSYENYLQLLMMLQNNKEVIYRSMDVMQADINRKYNSEFRMSESVMAAEMSAEYHIEALFTALPFVSSVLNENFISEDLKINVSYSYED